MNRCRSAFTLIELILAVAIGGIVVYAAYTGFRLSAQTITISKRMSVENRLIQNGIIAAVNDIDSWTSFDNPRDASEQGLRGSGQVPWVDNVTFPSDQSLGQPSQLPFTPFSISWSSVPAAKRFSSNNTWSASDPETWYRGNFAQRMQVNRILTGIWWATPASDYYFDASSLSPFGRYGMFTNLNDTTALGPTVSITGGTSKPHSDADSGAYGTVDVRWTWRDNQVMNLRQTLGLYGMMDYLPADSQYVFYQGEIIPTWELTPWGEWHWSWTDSYWKRLNRGRDALDGAIVTRSPWGGYMFGSPNSHMSAYDVIVNTHRNDSRRAEKGGASEFNLRTTFAKPLMTDAKPDTWPNVDYSTKRYTYRGQFVDACRVHWTNPLTGEAHGVWFNTFGTTFRGARQQRQPGTAVAVWHMPKVDRDSNLTLYRDTLGIPANDQNLDTFTAEAP